MGLLIGLDIGTTKLCVLALDYESGMVRAVEDTANDTRLSGDADAAEQDAAAIRNRSLDILRSVITRCDASDIEAIGVTGQMHGVVVVDRQGYPLAPLATWQDGRGTRGYRSTGYNYAEELARRLGADGVEASGCSPATGYGAVTLLRMVEERTLPKEGRALTIHDFIVRSLCGAEVIDPTDAASWGIFDTRDGSRWLPEAHDTLGVPQDLLPDVIPTGSIAGKLLPEMASQVGLPTGLPVATALGDNQASFIGSAPYLRETALFNLGTGGQMSVAADRFARIKGLDTRPLIAGQWLLVGASLCGGRAYEILEWFYARVGKELFGIEPTEKLYQHMNEIAARAAADADGMIARTSFEGSRIDPSSRGKVENITSTNLTPANLTQAVITGMALELVEYLSLARSVGAAPRLLAGSGNAVRRNPLVRSEIEKQTGMRLRMPPNPEEAAVGAALTAGVAVGLLSDWSEAGKVLFRE